MLTVMDVLVSFVPVILALGGAYVSIRQPNPRLHWYFFAGFLVFGFLSAGATLVARIEARAQSAKERKETKDAVDNIGNQVHEQVAEIVTQLQAQQQLYPPQVKPSPSARNVKPSFVYVVPGVWALDGTWYMMVKHYGPQPVQNVEIVVTDKDRQKAMATDPSITVDQMTRTLHFDEIDPIEGVWAKLFPWKPLNPDHEHYFVQVACRGGAFHETLNVERVNDKWFWEMNVIDQISKRVLINCRDAGFPSDSSHSLEPCFPRYTTSHMGA